MKTKIVLRQKLSPGDDLVLTAALECLGKQHKGNYEIYMDVVAGALFKNNPHITGWLTSSESHEVAALVNQNEKKPPNERAKTVQWGEYTVVNCQYPLVHRSNQEPRHFMEAFVFDIADKLNINLRLTTNHPHLYLSPDELAPIPKQEKPYVLINAGTKKDYTCKGAGQQIYQEIVDALKDRLNFFQVGELSHLHKPLDGVTNLIGKTTIRELLVMAYHSAAGVGPISLLHHVYAAFKKPYVAFLGGREPLAWEYYPTAVMLSKIGQMECCRTTACWKSRVVPLGDGDKKDSENLCSLPMRQDDGEMIPGCMKLLGSTPAIEALDDMIWSGVIKV